MDSQIETLKSIFSTFISRWLDYNIFSIASISCLPNLIKK